MPITPEDLTELQSQLAAGTLAENPNYLALTGLGLRVRTETEEQTLLDSYATTRRGEVVSELATNIEKDILEATGIEKKPNEKYYDYLKRATGGIKSELENLKKAGNPTAAATARITELEALLQGKDAEKEKEVNEIRGTFAQRQINDTVTGAINSVKPAFKPLDAALLNDVVDARRARFMATYTPEMTQDGSVIFKDKDGKTVNGPDYKPATAEYLVKDFFKDLLAEDKKQPGAGSGGQEPGANPAPLGELPASVKTKVDLVDYLSNVAKLKANSKEYNEAYAKYSKDLPLR